MGQRGKINSSKNTPLQRKHNPENRVFIEFQCILQQLILLPNSEFFPSLPRNKYVVSLFFLLENRLDPLTIKKKLNLEIYQTPNCSSLGNDQKTYGLASIE